MSELGAIQPVRFSKHVLDTKRHFVRVEQVQEILISVKLRYVLLLDGTIDHLGYR